MSEAAGSGAAACVDVAVGGGVAAAGGAVPPAATAVGEARVSTPASPAVSACPAATAVAAACQTVTVAAGPRAFPASMPRVDAVFRHPLFQRELARVEAAEADRAFCRHGLTHLLDVARVAWILNADECLGLERELVYAAALLHDIGRAAQYATGEPHDVAGERIAAEILGTVGDGARFSESERARILGAVRGHRGSAGAGTDRVAGRDGLVRLIARADKLSRPCYACAARAACYWPDERKNLTVKI